MNIENNFSYHPPKDDYQLKRYEEIRMQCKSLAFLITELTPESREQSLAITKLEECCMWANAAIARNE